MWRLIILVFMSIIFTQSMEFPEDVDETATLVSASAKADIGLQFQLPNRFLGDVTLNETIAREYGEFLVVKSAPVEVLQSEESTAPFVLSNVMEAKTKQQNSVAFYESCGTTKTCFGFPDNCVDQQNCAAVVSAAIVGGRYILELKSDANNVRYVSLAFSTDTIMGNDANMDCIVEENGSVHAFSSWITPRPGLAVTREGVPQDIISLLDASYIDETIYCKLERDPITTIQGKEFDLINNNFHFLVAIGTAVTATSVGRHDLGRSASPQPLNFTEEQQNRDPIYDGCGTTKTCIGLPADCVEQQNCAAVVSAVGVGGRFIFELKSGATNVRYVSLAFSTDTIMGNDANMDCILEEDGSIRAYSSWITPRPSLGVTRQGVPQTIISLLDASNTDGSIYCKLERDPVTTIEGKEFDLISDKFHVLIAIGTTVTATSVGRHDLGRIASTQPLNFTVEQPNRDPIYEGCGTTKICVGLPANCVEQQNCDAVVSGVDIGGRFIFELKSGANNVRYVSLAFSTDTIMGNDASMDCILEEDGSVGVYSSWITPRPSLGATREGVPQNIISLLDASHIEGSIYCKLERDPVTTLQGKEFDLINDKFHLLVAIGSTVTATSVGMHNLGRIASTQPLNFTIEPENEDPTPDPTPEPIPSPIYEGCGITKTCFGMPNNCVEQQNCAAVVTVSFNAGRFLFELQSGANNVQYVALGFSTDEIMGDDANMECIEDQGSIRAYSSWNTPRPSLGVTRQGVPQNIKSLLESSYVGGKIYCKLERDPVTIVQGKEFDLFKSKFHLLIAIGTTVSATSVGPHDLGRIASTQPLNFTEVGSLEGRSLILYRLHGAFMLAAWIGSASIGMLLARYFKQTWVGSSLCGKDQWFSWHRILMIATWALTIAAFVIIFVEVGGWSAEDNPHAVLGTISTILCFIQPFMAVFRPGPADKNRPIFNWAHWAVGNVSYVLAIITIFFAVELSVAQLPQWFYWILIPFVGFHALMHLIFLIAAEYSKIRSTQDLNTVISNVIKERNIDAPIAAEYNNIKSTQNLHTVVSNGNKERDIDAPIAAEYNNTKNTQHFTTVVSNGIKEPNTDAPYSALRKGLLGIYVIIVLSFMIALIVISVLVPI